MLSQKPWQAVAVIQLIAGVFTCLCLGIIAVALLQKAGAAAFATPDSFASVVLSTLSFQGATWGLIFYFLKFHEVSLRDAFGWGQPHLLKTLLLAGGVLVATLPVVLGLQQLSALGLEKLGWPAEDQRAVDLILNAKSGWLRGYLVFFAMVLAPVAEEFLFRGVLYPFIKQLGRPKLALFGVSFLFALIHLNVPSFVSLFVLALVFTWLYEKTDCLLAPIAAHSLFNTANLVILFAQNR